MVDQGQHDADMPTAMAFHTWAVEGLLPVRGGERLLPRHCVRASFAAADIKLGGVGMLVAGLCLALGGEPNLRKKKGWLFFAARRVSWAIACDPTLACATGRRAHSARAEAGGEAQWHLHVPQQCRAPASCDGSAVYAESDQWQCGGRRSTIIGRPATQICGGLLCISHAAARARS